jgi:hypothetical protein
VGASNAGFGGDIAGRGDFDGDGFADFVIGAAAADIGGQNTGSVYVYSGFGGTLLHVWHGAVAEGFLGQSVGIVSDLDGDGRDDVAAGAPTDGSFANAAGMVRAWSTASFAELLAVPGLAANEESGWDLANLGDVTGDGRGELAIGAFRALGDSGRLRAYSGAGAPLATLAPLSGGCGGFPQPVQLILSGAPVLGTTLTATIQTSWTNAVPGVLLVALAPPIPMPVGNGCTLYLDPNAAAWFPFLTSQTGTFDQPLPVPLAPWLAGTGGVMQAAVVPPAGPPNFVLTNARSFTLGFTP